MALCQAPNPTRGDRIALVVTAARGGAARLALFSPAGREVYSLGRVTLVAGTYCFVCDFHASSMKGTTTTVKKPAPKAKPKKKPKPKRKKKG